MSAATASAEPGSGGGRLMAIELGSLVGADDDDGAGSAATLALECGGGCQGAAEVEADPLGAGFALALADAEALAVGSAVGVADADGAGGGADAAAVDEPEGAPVDELPLEHEIVARMRPATYGR